LEARFEVAVEQYSVKLNIEAETAATIARTMILPAGLRHLELIDDAGSSEAVTKLHEETSGLVGELVEAIFALEQANDHDGPEGGLKHARYMRDTVIPAMDAVRAAADQLERIVAD